MAWNEPGNSGDKDKDPWGSKNKEQGPPDLDEVIRNIQRKLGGLFGGGGGSGKRRGGATPGNSSGIISLLVILLAVWLAYDSVYIIDQSERGVVTRFGKYVDTIQPGLSIRLPRPIERVETVNITQVRRLSLQGQQLLTKDLNLIRISLVVLFKVKNEIDYLFKVQQPDFSLKESTESALREVVGGKTMDDILSKGGGREELINQAKVQIQETIDKYQTGLSVVKVNLESTQPPKEVQAAFQDAIKAEEDQDRYIKQAEAYSRDIIPKAEGDAQRLVEEAEAYKQQIVNKAEGEASRYQQILKEYRKAPEVTRKRLYLDTMEQMLANSSKVLVKVREGNNLLYLPIDRFMKGGTQAATPSSSGYAPGQATGTPGQAGQPLGSSRDRTRERRVR